jgi:hypothetical protein
MYIEILVIFSKNFCRFYLPSPLGRLILIIGVNKYRTFIIYAFEMIGMKIKGESMKVGDKYILQRDCPSKAKHGFIKGAIVCITYISPTVYDPSKRYINLYDLSIGFNRIILSENQMRDPTWVLPVPSILRTYSPTAVFCTHPNKKVVHLGGLSKSYYYCPDCKKDLGNV